MTESSDALGHPRRRCVLETLFNLKTETPGLRSLCDVSFIISRTSRFLRLRDSYRRSKQHPAPPLICDEQRNIKTNF